MIRAHADQEENIRNVTAFRRSKNVADKSTRITRAILWVYPVNWAKRF